MKTIKNVYNTEYISEGILSSTKTGAASIVQEFIDKYFKYASFEKISSNTVSYEKRDISFENIPDNIIIPINVEKCNNLTYKYNPNKTIILPKEANVVSISNCKNLEKLLVNGKSVIKELFIDDCEKLDFLDDLQDLECEKVVIKGCNITTLSGFKNISMKLVISGCKKLKNFDFNSKQPINIKLNSCRIKKFDKINCNKLEISLLRKSSDLSLDIMNMQELYVSDCDFENIELKGNTCNVVVIEECEKLKSLSTVDCKKSLSLVDLPELEEYNFPTRFSGIIVLDNVKRQPEVNCKKLINR
jgi:hypothetical protein